MNAFESKCWRKDGKRVESKVGTTSNFALGKLETLVRPENIKHRDLLCSSCLMEGTSVLFSRFSFFSRLLLVSTCPTVDKEKSIP